MLQTEVTKNVIALSRQARKERFITYFSEPWRLCVFARDTFFLIFSLSQNFKYLWLDFGFGILDCSDLIVNFGFRPIENRQWIRPRSPRRPKSKRFLNFLRPHLRNRNFWIPVEVRA